MPKIPYAFIGPVPDIIRNDRLYIPIQTMPQDDKGLIWITIEVSDITTEKNGQKVKPKRLEQTASQETLKIQVDLANMPYNEIPGRIKSEVTRTVQDYLHNLQPPQEVPTAELPEKKHSSLYGQTKRPRNAASLLPHYFGLGREVQTQGKTRATPRYDLSRVVGRFNMHRGSAA